MSKIYGGGFVTVVSVGVSAVTGAASARSAIPVASDGNRPRYIRVTALNETHVRIGDVTVVATDNDLMIQPGDGVNMAVPNGVTHIAYIQGAAGAGKVNVAPLENI